MPCIKKKNTLLCIRRSNKKYCAYCGDTATLLCDWPMPNGNTCDSPICSRCSVNVSYEKDYCKEHTFKKGA
jgi:hypothetical protein